MLDYEDSEMAGGLFVTLMALALSGAYYYPSVLSSSQFSNSLASMLAVQLFITVAVNIAAYFLLKAKRRNAHFMQGIAIGEMWGWTVYIVVGGIFGTLFYLIAG